VLLAKGVVGGSDIGRTASGVHCPWH